MSKIGFPLVVYSHCEFKAFLKIFIESKALGDAEIIVVNSNDKLIETAIPPAQVLSYDDSLEYSDRLFNTLRFLDSEWILFTHEIDLPLSIDFEFLNRALLRVQSLGGVRLNLQVSDSRGTTIFDCNTHSNYGQFISEAVPNTTYLREYALDEARLLVDPWLYSYNVNPSILHLPTFLKFLDYSKGLSYRAIERLDADKWHLSYRTFNLFTTDPLSCGYFRCAKEYVFCHMTHYKMLSGLFKSNNLVVNEQSQPMTHVLHGYLDTLKRYQSIIPESFWSRLDSSFRS
jgi:hypothetical protein